MDKVWLYDDIQGVTEDQARAMADASATVKEHSVYFVDFGGRFGYSCLVFHSGRHIYYANDYELHHTWEHKTHDELKASYIRSLESKLFTDDEIAAPLTSYDEYKRRENFLINYYVMRVDHVSMFGADEKRRTDGMVFDPFAFAWVNDLAFAQHHTELHSKLIEAEKAMKENFDYWKSAFYYEMCNHEYGINWQGDYDTLSVFGRIDYISEYSDTALPRYFKQLGFSDVQRRAYYAARTEYNHKHKDY